MSDKLNAEARKVALESLPQWSDVAGRDAIKRMLRFTDFNEAFAFITRVALKAEQLNHHPEWSNVYNRVDVVLSTHDVGGLSPLDIDMARFIDSLA